MPPNIKAEPLSPERDLPPTSSAGERSIRPPRDMEDDDEDGIEVIGGDTPQNAAAKRNKGIAPSKKKGKASGAKKTAVKEWNYTYMPASNDQRKGNGRVQGRNLITWNRPRMAEKLLLHIMYECSRAKIEIPWDLVAHRLHPGSTGGAIVQHLNRLRTSLIAEGHMVPPICQKPGSRVFVDPDIRGYIRKFPESDDLTTTRPVNWKEPTEDRRFNLPNAWDAAFKGSSIRYDFPSAGNTAPETTPPASDPDPPAPKTTSPKKGRGGKRATSDRVVKREVSTDPDLLDSDAEYSPVSKRARKQARRNTRASKSTCMNDDDADEGEKEVLPKKVPRKRLQQDVHGDAGASNNRVHDNGYIEIEDDNVQNSGANVYLCEPIQAHFMGNAFAGAQIGGIESAPGRDGYRNFPGNAGHGGTFHLQNAHLANSTFGEQFDMSPSHAALPMSIPYGIHHNSHNPMLGEGSYVNDSHEMDMRRFSVQHSVTGGHGSRPAGSPDNASNRLASAGPGSTNGERADMLLPQANF